MGSTGNEEVLDLLLQYQSGERLIRRACYLSHHTPFSTGAGVPLQPVPLHRRRLDRDRHHARVHRARGAAPSQ